MQNPEKAILAALIYYDLLDYPLTSVEIFKYLSALGRGASFLEIEMLLHSSPELQKRVGCCQGLYFLKGRDDLVGRREEKMKLVQSKWRKLKKGARWLAAVPFLRLAAVTGSLTSCSVHSGSDFDLLVVLEGRRFWTSRILLTGLFHALGKRRRRNLTQDRFCLNCYLAKGALEILPEAKPRDFHSAQEYGRLTPIFEVEPLYSQFLKDNRWLEDYLASYPWPGNFNAKRIKPFFLFEVVRKFGEWVLGGRMGEKIEKLAGQWQWRRIMRKKEQGPADQVHVSGQRLIFHPGSKGYELMKNFNLKYERLIQ